MSQALHEAPVRYDVSWGSIAWVAGLTAAATNLLTTVLFLLDVTGIVAAQPQFRSTDAGLVADRARYYVDFFERGHDLLSNIAVRDTSAPIRSMAVMVLAVAVAQRLRWRPPAVVLAVLFLVVGCAVDLVNNVVYLGELRYFSSTGWDATPPTPIGEVGRPVTPWPSPRCS